VVIGTKYPNDSATEAMPVAADLSNQLLQTSSYSYDASEETSLTGTTAAVKNTNKNW
jgi:hypothetical protein